MQKLTYINPLEETIVVSSLGPAYVLESVHGIGAVETTMTIHTPAGLDGALYHGLRLNDREITLNLYVEGDSLQSMYERRANLIRALSSSHSRSGQPGELWYENDYGRWWIPAIVKQGPREAGRRLKHFFPCQVVFYCPDSAWRAEEATIDKLAYLSGGFKFPLVIPAIDQESPGIRFGARGYQVDINNMGDAPTPLEFTISGPATRPRIEHKNSGAFISVNRELAAGDILTISTERGRKMAKITRATGVKEEAMAYIDASSTWFQLSPGQNSLEYTSGNDTTVATVLVRAWSRYGGV